MSSNLSGAYFHAEIKQARGSAAHLLMPRQPDCMVTTGIIIIILFYYFFFSPQNFRSANLPPLFSNMEIFMGGFLQALAVGKAKGPHTAADWDETSGIPAEKLSLQHS